MITIRLFLPVKAIGRTETNGALSATGLAISLPRCSLRPVHRAGSEPALLAVSLLCSYSPGLSLGQPPPLRPSQRPCEQLTSRRGGCAGGARLLMHGWLALFMVSADSVYGVVSVPRTGSVRPQSGSRPQRDGRVLHTTAGGAGEWAGPDLGSYTTQTKVFGLVGS